MPHTVTETRRGLLLERFGWLRAHAQDANDGTITTAGVIEGLAGAGASSHVFLIAGMGALVAGAIAMGATEYSEAAMHRDEAEARLAHERWELEQRPEAELDELTGLYEAKGLDRPLARRVAVALTEHDALAAHAEAEHGIADLGHRGRALLTALSAAGAFAAGSLLPLLMMILLPASWRVRVTVLCVVVSLALTAWLAAAICEVRPARPVLRTAGIGLGTMLLTYLVGLVLPV